MCVSARYKYNSLSEKIEEIGYLDNGSVYEDYTYLYNDKHQMVKCVNHLSDTNWNVIYTYKYDEKGNKIEEVTKQNKAIIKTTYQYDDKRNKILENHYSDAGLIEETYLFKYNDSGDVIEAKAKTVHGGNELYELNPVDSAVRLENLDRAGNWLKKTEFSRMLPPRITKRVIVYY